MFETVTMAPPDAILGLTEAFNKDPRPNKINLGVGVYKDAAGKTPVLASVKKAEEKMLRDEATKNYRPIDGAPEYNACVQEMLFGAGHALLAAKRTATAHTPGGTGALRVAGDYLRKQGVKTIWMSDPTWPNHPQVFEAAGLAVQSYPYFDPATNGVAIDKMLSALKTIPGADAVLLHACCHNPSGADPSSSQWSQIAGALKASGALPLVDFAYQGFGIGLHEDAVGLIELTKTCPEMLVASSFSKNFGLYNERVGALTVVAGSEAAAQSVMSHVKSTVRANYSNPPAHGGSIVSTILRDPALRSQWEVELTQMRDRINGMRKLFVETLKKKGAKRDFSFIAQQRGMFSFSGLSKDQVAALKEKHAVYVVGSGRINVAGMTEGNMDALCTAIVDVL